MQLGPALTTKTNHMVETHPSNVYLITINKPVAYMPLDMYTQWASKGPGDRFYISRGARGHMSISSKNATILAQQVIYIKTN